jgi:DNA repair protein RadD
VIVLRPYQAELVDRVHSTWQQGARNVLMRLDTGGGKTSIFSDMIRRHNGAACLIAHRSELVGQISLAIARNGVRHNVIASEATRRAIARLHVEELGYSLIDPGSRVVVASVDTLVRQELPAHWVSAVTLWVVDEGHHLVVDNKWHRAIANFTHPDCRGLLPTATPKRADGKGLGRHADGVADVMVEGPPMRWLIDQGYLTDYRIVCPPSDMEMLADVSASGDWSTKQLREAAQRSHIVGDIVKAYLHFAKGKLGITFSTDVETAGEITTAYRLAGVRAETLTGKTDDHLRRSIIRRFAAREIDQIVAVDIISEGFDLPAIEVASMGRPTASLALYMQQFGRTLRTMPGKAKALIIDHAANVIRHHGPPDKPRVWSLDKGDRRKSASSDAIPLRVCVGCFEPYERIFRACPHCGHYEPPRARSSPGMVDGDLAELSPEILKGLREAVAAADVTIEQRRQELRDAYAPAVGINAGVNRHAERQAAIAFLRLAMACEGGRWHAEGLDDVTMQRRFYLTYGIDVLSAQALDTAGAYTLAAKING